MKLSDWYVWKHGQRSLKEYRIENEIKDGYIKVKPKGAISTVGIELKIGSIHNFETNEELNTCIVL